jgi:4-amino-4-deoxy-L-arabinose transferase-like glycosyltransferase
MSRRTSHILLGLILLIGVSTWLWVSLPLPNYHRWWDERYSMNNVQHILESGQWMPGFAWYPALSHLPLTVILKSLLWIREGLGLDSPGIVRADGSLGPWAFWIGRWTSSLFAAFSVIWTYRLGLEAFSRSAGVLAALFLVSSPTFHFYAAVFKPDMLALALTLLAFSAAVRAFERPSFSRYLLAGGLVGLAGSAKQTGAIAAIPLIFATVLRPRNIRRWLALGLAGLLSALLFVAIHPDFGLIQLYLRIGQRYQEWALHQPRADYPTVAYLPVLALGSRWHGPVVGTAALLGLLGISVQLFRSRLRRPEDATRALLVSFVISYPIICALVSSHPKFNLFLPTLPFTALAAGWCLTTLWNRLAPKPEHRLRRPLQAILLAALLLALGIPFVDYVYTNAISTTTQGEAAWLIRSHSRSLAHRSVAYEQELGAPNAGFRPFVPTENAAYEQPADRLLDLPSRTLDLMDFELFALDRLSGPEAKQYRARLERCDADSVWRLEPRFLRRRGPALVLLKHPWKKASVFEVEWTPDDRKRGEYSAQLPATLKKGRVVSLDFAWPAELVARCELRLAEEPLELFHYHRSPQDPRFMTPRLELRSRNSRLRLQCAKRVGRRAAPRTDLIVWRPERQSLAEAARSRKKSSKKDD